MNLDPNTITQIRRLMVAHAQSILPGIQLGERELFPADQINTLVATASYLAFSEENEDRRMAYEIAIRSIFIAASGQIALARACY